VLVDFWGARSAVDTALCIAASNPLATKGGRTNVSSPSNRVLSRSTMSVSSKVGGTPTRKTTGSATANSAPLNKGDRRFSLVYEMKHSFVGYPSPNGFTQLCLGDGAVVDPNKLRDMFPTMEADFLAQYRAAEKLSEDQRNDIFVRLMGISAMRPH
jgi:hypothetical protein